MSTVAGVTATLDVNDRDERLERILCVLQGEVTGYAVACRSASLDASEREANGSHSWVAADDLIASLGAADDDAGGDAGTWSLAHADEDDARRACAAAEANEPIEYIPVPPGAIWRVLSYTRPAAGWQAGIVERYYWPRGGW